MCALPGKAVPKMTYYVLIGMLNLNSLYHSKKHQNDYTFGSKFY